MSCDSYRGIARRPYISQNLLHYIDRLESTSEQGRIHCSKETADEIIKSGYYKRNYIEAKGKGSLETFWIIMDGEKDGSVGSAISATEMTLLQRNGSSPDLGARTSRLIDWNVEMLITLLRQIVAKRCAVGKEQMLKSSRTIGKTGGSFSSTQASKPLDEVREIIRLPEFSEKQAKQQQKPEKVSIPKEVEGELKELVSTIAGMYNDNPFHSKCTEKLKSPCPHNHLSHETDPFRLVFQILIMPLMLF